MYRKYSLWASILIGLAMLSPAHAETKFEDLSVRFAMDLPDSYEFSMEAAGFFMFAGDGGPLFGVFEDGSDDLDASYNAGVEYAGTMIDDLKVVESTTLEINGHPAKYGLYKGTMEGPNKSRVPMYTHVIGIVLDSGSLYLMSVTSEDTLAKWSDATKKMYHSIREVGDPVTGARNVKPAG